MKTVILKIGEKKEEKPLLRTKSLLSREHGGSE